jgi:hypothetical protein
VEVASWRSQRGTEVAEPAWQGPAEIRKPSSGVCSAAGIDGGGRSAGIGRSRRGIRTRRHRLPRLPGRVVTTRRHGVRTGATAIRAPPADIRPGGGARADVKVIEAPELLGQSSSALRNHRVDLDRPIVCPGTTPLGDLVRSPHAGCACAKARHLSARQVLRRRAWFVPSGKGVTRQLARGRCGGSPRARSKRRST